MTKAKADSTPDAYVLKPNDPVHFHVLSDLASRLEQNDRKSEADGVKALQQTWLAYTPDPGTEPLTDTERAVKASAVEVPKGS